MYYCIINESYVALCDMFQIINNGSYDKTNKYLEKSLVCTSCHHLSVGYVYGQTHNIRTHQECKMNKPELQT